MLARPGDAQHIEKVIQYVNRFSFLQNHRNVLEPIVKRDDLSPPEFILLLAKTLSSEAFNFFVEKVGRAYARDFYRRYKG